MHFVSRFWYRTTLWVSLVVLGILTVLMWGAYLLSQPYQGYSGPSTLVEIPHGTRLVGIAEKLKKEGVIRHRRAFIVAMALERRRNVIRAGEYNFEGPMSEFEVIHKLLRGEVHYHQVTIPEGSNLFAVAEILENAGLAKQEEVLNAAYDVELVNDIAPEAVSLEGYLFPDTYKFERHTPARELVTKMVERFREFLKPEYLKKARKENLTLHQAVILASLIEKETGKENERPLVAAVFHNRLEKKQRLECDPTVVYAALLAHRYRGKIYRSDLQLDSPFNTYVHYGLPLGPIANPGKASLDAAAEPAPVNYLYFVSDNNGGHVFSATLTEHQNAVRKYRRTLKEIALSQREPVASMAIHNKPKPGTDHFSLQR